MYENEQQLEKVRSVLDHLDHQRLPDEFMRHPPELYACCEKFQQQLTGLNKLFLDTLFEEGIEIFPGGFGLNKDDEDHSHEVRNLTFCGHIFDSYSEDEYSALIRNGFFHFNHICLLAAVADSDQRHRLENAVIKEHLTVDELAKMLPGELNFDPPRPKPRKRCSAGERLMEAWRRYEKLHGNYFREQTAVAVAMFTCKEFSWHPDCICSSILVDMAIAVGDCIEAIREIFPDLPPVKRSKEKAKSPA